MYKTTISERFICCLYLTLSRFVVTNNHERIYAVTLSVLVQQSETSGCLTS